MVRYLHPHLGFCCLSIRCIPVCSSAWLFVLQHGSALAYILLYVDDIILTASSTELLQDINVCHFADGLILTQRQYAIDLLQCAGMSECHPTATLVDTKAKLSAADGLPVADST